MIILNKQEVFERKDEIISFIKAGKIFIYPTDTIYGMGCDAVNEKSVQKIRDIKKRDKKPFSVIAPSKKWIEDSMEIADLKKLDVLPGPYTLICKMKDLNLLPPNVSFMQTLGLRIPDNWFTDIISEAGLPFITTSVNISGEKNMEKLEDVSKEFLEKVDYVIYEGPIARQQSTRIDLS